MKTAFTVAVLLALIAFSIDFRSKHPYKKENIMSTTPKKPHKHAEIIKAWAEGKTIQTFWNGKWNDCNQETYQFSEMAPEVIRIKPEPAAPVYPKSNLSGEEMHTIINEAAGGLFNEFTAIANAAIRRAIDDGQVVVPGSVVNAEFDPDFQGVKTTAQQNEEFAKAVQKRLEHAERVLKANGFTYEDGVGWSIPMATAQAAVEMGKKFADPNDLAIFGQRVGRAVCNFLGKDREEVPTEVIDAIVLLEKAK